MTVFSVGSIKHFLQLVSCCSLLNKLLPRFARTLWTPHQSAQASFSLHVSQKMQPVLSIALSVQSENLSDEPARVVPSAIDFVNSLSDETENRNRRHEENDIVELFIISQNPIYASKWDYLLQFLNKRSLLHLFVLRQRGGEDLEGLPVKIWSDPLLLLMKRENSLLPW